MNEAWASLTMQIKIEDPSISTWRSLIYTFLPKPPPSYGLLWMSVERCHPLQAPLFRPSCLGMVKSRLQGVCLLFLYWSDQGRFFLWAKLMHIWKLTVHLQASDGQNQRISPSFGLHFVGSIAVGESFPLPQALSRFAELRQATS